MPKFCQPVRLKLQMKGGKVVAIKPTQFRLALEFFKYQVLCALVVALLLLPFNHFAAASFSYGAIVILLGNGFLTWRVYQKHKSLKAIPMLWGFLGGEFGKYCLLVIFTVLLAKYVKMNWLFYVMGLALPQLLGVIVYGIVSKGTKKI